MRDATQSESGVAGDAARVTASNVDLTNCDREQIQLVGAIQPHGALLALAEPELRVVQASANAAAFLGLADDPVVGQTVEALFGEEIAQTLRARLAATALTGVLAHLATVPRLPRREGRLHLFGNRIDGLLLVELERGGDTDERPEGAVFLGLRNMIGDLQRAASLDAFLDTLVARIRALSGFDRVLVYRFDRDGSGEVVAESAAPGLETYLGLHYPASDIPAPARRLFGLLPLRHLPDVDYVPVPLLPQALPQTDGQPIDLSYSFLRSVSEMYTGYLRNMGARASMVLPLQKAGELWGLISCMHHSEPRYLTYERRIPIEFLVHTAALLMGQRADLDRYAYRDRLARALLALSDAMRQSEPFYRGLIAGETPLLSAIDAEGAALIVDGKIMLLGKTPSQQQIALLADWLAQRGETVFSTHALAQAFAPAADFSAVASGLLTVRLGRTGSDRVLWLRPEALCKVHWAGDPSKPVEVVEDEREIRLRPRTSFALWKESVRGQSRPWLDCELDYAARVRQAILDAMAERASALARINAELERSNLELDAFAYAASHDLKEPLRGIHNFADLLKLEDAPHWSERGLQRLGTIQRLAGRMEGLIESLMHYARAFHDEPEISVCALGELAQEALELLPQSFPGQRIAIAIDPALPRVRCDRTRVSMIFHNLISNAIKYNDQAEKRVEIGCVADCDPPVFFVRDNGIGIAPAHRELVFRLFRRLHGREEYGGGAGVGLSLVHKAVRGHGGRIWVESAVGQGSTFYFTLAPARANASLYQ